MSSKVLPCVGNQAHAVRPGMLLLEPTYNDRASGPAEKL